MQVSFFNSIYEKKPSIIDIKDFFEKIKSNADGINFEEIRSSPNIQELKKKLPCISVSGTFANGHASINLTKHSGLIQIDIDKLDNVNELKSKLIQDEFVFACFISPSGRGIKAIIKILSIDHLKSFEDLRIYFKKKYKVDIDLQCKDVGRLMYLSYDPELYINENSFCYETKTENLISLIKILEERKIDITKDYKNWLSIGFALSSELGENGRSFFLQISKFYPKYNEIEANSKYDDCLKNNNNSIKLASVYYIAKEYQVQVQIPIEQNKISTRKIEITGEYLLSLPNEKMQCLIEPIIPRTGLICLAGSSDTGKSSLLRQLSIGIVAGKTDFLGFEINATHRSVIYVSTEDEQMATSWLLSKQKGDIDNHDLRGLRFVFDVENLLTELEQRLIEKPADVIIIDCFADIFGNDLKDSNQIRAFLNKYQQLSQKHGCLILFLHHIGKRTENKEPSKNNLLSGQGFEAKMRLVIELRADFLNPNNRHFCIVKGNYLPAEFKRESHVIYFNEEDFSFTNTGDRVPFEQLIKQEQNNSEKEKYIEILRLKATGLNYETIAKNMAYANKSSISKIIKKGEKMGWSS